MPLSPLTSFRAALSLCLTLGVLPALASPPRAGTVETRELPLRHTTPAAILKQMHWDQTRDYPDGVTLLRADTKNNALSVVATPAGFAGLQELVKLLDFTPRQVRIRFVLARAATADLQAAGLHGFSLIPVSRLGSATTASSAFVGMASGGIAVQLLKTLTRRTVIPQSPTFTMNLTTTNNADASLGISRLSPLLDRNSFTFAATPRVNSDNSVTLRLHPSLSKRGLVKTRQEVQIRRTINSGDTIVLLDLFPQAANAKTGSLVLFVTPTILPLEKGASAKQRK